MNLINVIKLSEKKCSVPIQAELKYATEDNFVGRIIDGYTPGLTDIALLTPKAADSLCMVQNELITEYGYGLLIYDAYRPKRAVLDFLSWSKQPPASEYELQQKAIHYPNIEKQQLFELGYVVEDSNHCYGNTVDLVLLNNNTNEPLEMGACFDYMDTLSHITTDSSVIGENAVNNRTILSLKMQQFGFEPYYAEFWHFTHGGREGREVYEPMDIAITAELK